VKFAASLAACRPSTLTRKDRRGSTPGQNTPARGPRRRSIPRRKLRRRRRVGSIGKIYDGVVEEVWSAVSLRQALVISGRSWLARQLFANFPLFLRPRPDPLRQKLEHAATTDQREHRHYAAVTGEYFIEGLATAICQQFSIDARKAKALTKLHLEREAEFARFERFWRLAPLKSIALAVAAVLAAQVPKETFDVLGWSGAYGWYRLTLFGVLSALLLYIAAIGLFVQISITKGVGQRGPYPPHAVREATRLVLVHCELWAAPAAGGNDAPD
jgi:hypothetical protein